MNSGEFGGATGGNRFFCFVASLALPLVACNGGSKATVADPPIAGVVSAESPSEYIIGPGDTLKVVVAQNPDLNADVPVRPDGKISTPLAGDVVAVGKSPTQVARGIETVLSQYLRDPSVSVIVSNATGAVGQVRIVGRGVSSPKGLPYRSGMTVLDLVVQTGGLSQFAAGNRAKIVRLDKDGSHEIQVRLDDLLNKGKMSENVALRPGDVLVIPEAWF
jgi:polysaccharide export outer membrane protein